MDALDSLDSYNVTYNVPLFAGHDSYNFTELPGARGVSAGAGATEALRAAESFELHTRCSDLEQSLAACRGECHADSRQHLCIYGSTCVSRPVLQNWCTNRMIECRMVKLSTMTHRVSHAGDLEKMRLDDALSRYWPFQSCC